MTSKISFFNISKENRKRFLAVGVCLLFACLMQVIAFVIEIQNAFANYQPFSSHAEMIQVLEQSVRPSFVDGIVAIAFGVAFAYSGFGFLHSKTQSDFYGSLPVKRGKQYQMIFGNSVLFFFVSTVLMAAAKIVILGASHSLTGEFALLLVKGVFVQVLSFLASWVTAVLAIVLTGQWFVGLLAYGVFAVYMPLIIRYLIPSYASKFFETYLQAYRWESSVCSYFSPVSLSYGLTDSTEKLRYLVGIILWIIVVGAVSYVLFQKRPSEAAGRAMAFEKVNPVIRFLIVIPMALYAGIFLSEMSMQSSNIWLLTGIILGVVLFHGIIETIYESNIRAILAHKMQMAATLLICLAITAVFYFDLTGFDRWMPDAEDVGSVELTLNNMENRQSTFWGEAPDGLTGASAETVLALITEGSVSETLEDGENHSTISMETTFHMKNGTTKKRLYQIDEEKSMDLLNQLFADQDFKDDYFSLYTADRSKITEIRWNNLFETETVKLSSKELNELLDIYLGELDELSYSEIKSSAPCGQLTIFNGEAYYPYTGMTRMQNEENYYIYDSFDQTLEYLKEHGVDAKSYSDYEIKQINVTEYSNDYEESNMYSITDPEVIERYRDHFIYTDMSGFCGSSLYSENYSLQAVFLTPMGEYSVYFWMPEELAEKMVEE